MLFVRYEPLTFINCIVLLILIKCICADYTCICNYQVQRTVYTTTNDTSPCIGVLTEGDCYEVIQPKLMNNTWSSITFGNQVGYIIKDVHTDILSCPGSPSVNSTVRTSCITTTTVSTTSISNSPGSSVEMGYTSTSTIESATKTTSKNVISTTTTEPIDICPQFVYNVTNADNAYLIINQVEHKCYEFVQTHETWSTAESNCQKNGGHLVTIRNEKENNELFEYVKVYGDDVWLGLNDKNTEDIFTWISGENSTYLNWRSGHHNFFIHGSEDCVIMLSSSGHWDDIGCSHQYAYICEYASISAVSGHVAIQAPLGVDGDTRMCPSSVVFAARTDSDIILGQYGDSCYVLTNNSRETWTSAESQCKQEGGHLAYIRNADEQTFIEDFLYRHYSLKDTWIGLTDSEHEGQFEWSSGEAVTYTNWISGFNGTHHRDEDCVVMVTQKNGQWDEVYCGSHSTGIFSSSTERHQVLCQYKNQQHHVSSILIG